MTEINLGEVLDVIGRRDVVCIYNAHNRSEIYWVGSAGQTTLPPKFYGYIVTKIAAKDGMIEIGVRK